MLRNFLLIAAASSLLAPAASALDTAECGAVEEQVTVILDAEFSIEVVQSATSITQATGSGCVITDVDIYVEELGVTYRAERVAFSGTELMDWVRGDVILPSTVDALVEGVFVLGNGELPEDLQWLTGLRAESISLSATWNEGIQRLQISPLRIDLGDQNTVTMQLDGRAVGWRPYDMPLADFGVSEIGLETNFNGLFEQAILPPIVQNGNDMSPNSMAFLAAAAEGLMANASQTLISSDARAAIVDFLRALPNPRGFLGLTLTNDAPFSPERFWTDLRTGVPFATAVPNALNIDAIWAPFN